MEGRSDLYHFEADHELNDNWKAHFGYSWNRETYDASQVRVTAIDTKKGTLTRSMDGTQNAISTDRFTTASLEGKVDVRACSMTWCSASMTSTARSTAPT